MPSNTPNYTSSSLGDLPFFAARHNGRTIAIRRDSDYDAAVRSVKKVFPALINVSSSRIIFSAVFQDYGDISIEINQDLWADVVPKLKIVDVSVGEGSVDESEQLEENQALNNLKISRPMELEVQSGLQRYTITLPADSTVHTLRSTVQSTLPVQTSSFILSAPEFSVLRNANLLSSYNITSGSLVTVTANIRVLVTTPWRDKMPVMATLYANVSSLLLTVSSRADMLYSECSLTCGGQLLDDSKRLDEYPQIVPDCEIIVARREAVDLFEPYNIYVQSEWAKDEKEECMIYPTTTVLDLKVFLYNVNMISPDRQVHKIKDRWLKNTDIIREEGIRGGDTLIMNLYVKSTKAE